MDDILYILEGDPIPLARCRFAKHTRTVFDPQKTLKLVSQLTLKHQHGENPYYQGPLRLEALFYFHIPKTHRTTHPGDHHIYRPDADNLLKLIMDLGTGILWKEDCIIAEFECKKLYGRIPRTEFLVIELDKDEKEKESDKV